VNQTTDFTWDDELTCCYKTVYVGFIWDLPEKFEWHLTDLRHGSEATLEEAKAKVERAFTRGQLEAKVHYQWRFNASPARTPEEFEQWDASLMYPDIPTGAD